MKALAIAAALVLGSGTSLAADMKGMEMKDMSPTRMSKADKAGTHTAKGMVKKIDAKSGTVTLDHEPVKSMSWPSMTMDFKVKEKAVMEKLSAGRKVEFDFEQRGKEYVITKVK